MVNGGWPPLKIRSLIRGRKGERKWLRRSPARTCSTASPRRWTTTRRLSRCARSTSSSWASPASTRPSLRSWSSAAPSRPTCPTLRVRWPTRSSPVLWASRTRRWLRLSAGSLARASSSAPRVRARTTRRRSSSPSNRQHRPSG